MECFLNILHINIVGDIGAGEGNRNLAIFPSGSQFLASTNFTNLFCPTFRNGWYFMLISEAKAVQSANKTPFLSLIPQLPHFLY
jgi:hypothetical protein